MTKQIDESPAQYVMRCADVYATESGNKTANREALEAALEAALKPGEPVASIYITPEGHREVDDWKVELPVGRNKLYTAPPAQTPLSEAVRFGTQEQRQRTLEQSVHAPPAQTPPPRLKDTAVEACIKAVEDAFAWTGGHGEPSKPGPDAIANIIRSHFHVAQS